MTDFLNFFNSQQSQLGIPADLELNKELKTAERNFQRKTKYSIPDKS